jgi:hypothetical protein
MYEGWVTDFSAFVAHIGLCPPGHTLDRIDNNKGYVPGNVRWATTNQQSRNRRVTVRVDFEGESVALADIADQYDIDYRLLYERVIRQGWSVPDAITTPIRRKE